MNSQEIITISQINGTRSKYHNTISLKSQDEIETILVSDGYEAVSKNANTINEEDMSRTYNKRIKENGFYEAHDITIVATKVCQYRII